MHGSTKEHNGTSLNGHPCIKDTIEKPPYKGQVYWSPNEEFNHELPKRGQPVYKGQYD